MSYHCDKHGWRHLLNPCPSCPATASSGSLDSGIVGISSAHYRDLQSQLEACKKEIEILKGSRNYNRMKTAQLRLKMFQQEKEHEALCDAYEYIITEAVKALEFYSQTTRETEWTGNIATPGKLARETLAKIKGK